MEKDKKVEKGRFYGITALKGMCVGGSMLVPGVSGGSMAMILGIYDRLIEAVSSFFKHVGESLAFLASFGISAVVAMVLFAKPLLQLIERYEIPRRKQFHGRCVWQCTNDCSKGRGKEI